MSELGKLGKTMGKLHPRDRRRLDPVPERPTPKAKPPHKREKHFGLEYEAKWLWETGWRTHRSWFRTESARDQALRHHNRTRHADWMSLARPIIKGEA